MTHRDCVEGWYDLQEQANELPPGDEYAEVKRAISDIRDLLVKIDAQGQNPARKDELIVRLNKIFTNLNYLS